MRYGSDKREHRRERLAHGERLIVGGRVPLVAGDAAVEDAGAGANRHAAVALRIPRHAEARRDVVVVGLHDAAADARIAGEQQPLERGRRHRRLRARHERELAVLRIGEGELQVVADAEVQRHARMHAIVVLREQADVGAVVRLPHRRVLRHRRRQPEQEVGVGVARLAAVEREHAVVVEQRVVDDLLVRHFAAELERVIAADHAQAVFHREEVAAGVGAGNRVWPVKYPDTVMRGSVGSPWIWNVRIEIAERRRRDCSRARRTAARR